MVTNRSLDFVRPNRRLALCTGTAGNRSHVDSVHPCTVAEHVVIDGNSPMTFSALGSPSQSKAKVVNWALAVQDGRTSLWNFVQQSFLPGSAS